jgi:hypothetical protein
MLVRDTRMSDNEEMSNDKREKGLEALEAALESADSADAPEIAEDLAAAMSEQLDETADAPPSTEERPS